MEGENLVVVTDLQVEDVAGHRRKVVRDVLGLHPRLVRNPAGIMADRACVKVNQAQGAAVLAAFHHGLPFGNTVVAHSRIDGKPLIHWRQCARFD